MAQKHLKNRTLSHGSNPSNIGLWAMAQTPILLAFEPWLKPINYRTLSHGSNPQKTGLWAMAQTHQLLDFEPWLKPPKNGPLSHGSNQHLTCKDLLTKFLTIWKHSPFLFLKSRTLSFGSNPPIIGFWAMPKNFWLNFWRRRPPLLYLTTNRMSFTNLPAMTF